MLRSLSHFVLVISFSSILFAQSGSEAELAKLNSELVKAYSAGDFDAALAAARKLVDLSIEKFGKQHISTAKALQNRGAVEIAKGDDKAAEKTLEDSVDIFRRQADIGNLDPVIFADVIESLARIRMKKNVFLGEGLLKEALELREGVAPGSPQIANTLASLANISFWKRDFKRSVEQYTRALEVYSASKTTDLPDFTSVFYRARCSYRKARMESEFESLITAYGHSANFFGGKPAPGNARLIIAGVVNGKALHLAKPPYPAEARQANAQGIVEVDVLIGENGNVISACTSNTPHASLSESSEIAAYNSKFSPTRLEGKPIKVSGRITYRFSRR